MKFTTMILACWSFFWLLPIAALSQPADSPTFQVADVHPSVHGTNQFMRGGFLRGTRYELLTASMVDLIKTAYNVDDYKVLSGPSWLESDRFDVLAKAPAGTPPETIRLMLQNLLAERFQLKVHNDTKPLPAYALTVGKRRMDMKESDGTGDTGCQSQQQNGPNQSPGMLGTMVCTNMTMSAFAERMGGMAPAYIDGKPVVDMTELKGPYNFTIRWTGRGALSAAGPDGISFFDAVDKLGLKLELQKVPMAVIIVDSVNEKPTPNAPGVSKVLPPAPTEFEVVDIHPSDPADGGRGGRGGGFQPGGRIDVKGITVKQLITVAWNITSDDLLVGAPKWIDNDKFDLIAKAPTTGPTPQNSPPVDIDTLRLMVRAMLADRFKLVTHTEERPVSVYALVASKPKLKRADPLNRTGCKTSNSFGGSAPTFTYACLNSTVAQLVEGLQMASIGDITHPVIDATGLSGSWDIVLQWTPRIFGQMGMPGGGRGGDTPPQPPGTPSVAAASDPLGGMSMAEALEKQLGLKLELQKHPMPVLVIDHIEQKPTEN